MLPSAGKCVALIGCVAALAACSAAESNGALANASPGGAGGGANGDIGLEPEPKALSFDRTSTLTLAPGEVQELTVSATPPGVYDVRLALLPDANRDPNDASLDRADIVTDSAGQASVRLTAPTRPTTFRVRASVGTVTTELAVSVSEAGYATLVVHPNYGGKRTVTTWTATVRAGATCAALRGTPPPDGDLIASSDASGSPRVDSVPVGPALAVTLRAGHFAGGCADLTDVTADTTNEVTVDVKDRPMQLAGTDLEVALGIKTETPEWRASLEATAQLTLDALVSGAPDGLTALLDEMAVQAESSQNAFTAARSSQNWDTTLPVSLGADSSHRVENLVSSWMSEGLLGLSQSRTFVGRLSASGEPGQALFDLVTVADSDAQVAGFAPTLLATWTADPADTVLLGVNLFWLPSRLVTALAEPEAVQAAPTATTVPEALSSLLSCSDVAQALTTQGTQDAYAGCDAACTESLCDAALAAMWQRARDASGANAWKLSVSATGAATVDDEAGPQSFTGSWVGTAQTDAGNAGLGGPASGSQPKPPP